jgi:hypothetical protein
MVKTRISVDNSHILRLCPVDCVAKPPATIEAMGVHSPAAIDTSGTGRDARNQDSIALFETFDSGSSVLDYTYAFVP